MAVWHYFVAVFSEPKIKVFKAVTDTWECYSTIKSKKMPPNPECFETGVPLEEGGVVLYGSIREISGKSTLTLHNMTSSDWIGIQKNSRNLVEFCLKYEPEITYVYYAGSMRSPQFIFFTKKDGLLVDIRRMNILYPDNKSKKILEDCFGKPMSRIAVWEEFARLGPLLPVKKCKVNM